MFSGIVEEQGTILELIDTADGRRLKVGVGSISSDVKVGDSVSVQGVCLTVTKHGPNFFETEAMLETLRRSTVGDLQVGHKVNLERALKFSDRIGGHLVSGHIDAKATVDSIKEDGFAKVFTFKLESALAPYFVEKGSVAIDGVSLTIVDCDPADSTPNFKFSVALIPHTLSVTTLGALSVGDSVNIETDVIARYAARWLAPNVLNRLKDVKVSEMVLQ